MKLPNKDTVLLFVFSVFLFLNFVQVSNLLLIISAICLAAAALMFPPYPDFEDLRRVILQNKALVLFLCYAFISIVFFSSSNETCSRLYTCKLLNIVSIASWLLVCIVVFAAGTTKFDLNPTNSRIIIALACAVCAIGVHTLSQILFTDLGEPINKDGRFRLHFTISGRAQPNHIALCALILIALISSIYNQRPRLVGATTAFLAFLSGLTNSYAAMISILVGLIVLWPKQRAIATIQTLFAIAGFSSAWLLSSEAGLKTDSAIRRIDIYGEFMRHWLVNPLIGHGFATPLNLEVFHNKFYAMAHSVPLHTLVQGGVIGLLLMALVAISILKKSIELYNNNVVCPFLIVGYMAPLAMFQKGPLFWLPNATWLVTWAPVFVLLACNQRNSSRT